MTRTKRWYLYTITNTVNGKVYVGVTNHPRRRKWNHFSGRGSRIVAAAIAKYGKESLSFKAVICASFEYCLALEQAYVRHFNTLAPHGYNLFPGGAAREPLDETRRRLAASQRKRFESGFEREKARANLQVRLADPEFKERWQAGPKSPEARKRNSEARKAYFADPANRLRMSLARAGKPGQKGEAHSQRKLNEDQVREIRRSSLSCTKLAAQFGVSISTISDARCRKTWAHLPE